MNVLTNHIANEKTIKFKLGISEACNKKIIYLYLVGISYFGHA